MLLLDQETIAQRLIIINVCAALKQTHRR